MTITATTEGSGPPRRPAARKLQVSTAQWDAELRTDCCDAYNNAEVLITLKLGLRQINPAGGAAEGLYHDYGDATAPNRKIIKWTKDAWVRWTQNLVDTAQAYWDGKFWLTNNFPVLEYEHKGVRYRPNIWTRFKINLVKTVEVGPIDAHYVIDVVRLHPSVNWFGSHSTLYDSRDTRWIQKNTDSRGKAVMQQAHVHEMGHLLGLGHVDEGKAHCPKTGDTNAAVCYGVADEDMKNVMGGGMARTANLGIPWRRAVAQLTGKGNADTLTDWKSETLRHYPRTMEDVRLDRAITSRPHRH